jgi:hypothetical protein
MAIVTTSKATNKPTATREMLCDVPKKKGAAICAVKMIYDHQLNEQTVKPPMRCKKKKCHPSPFQRRIEEKTVSTSDAHRLEQQV